MTNFHTLSPWGWQPFFQQQLSLDEWETTQAARVTSVERSNLFLTTGNEPFSIPVTPNMPPVTVGDWLLLDEDTRFQRLLDRSTVFSRKAAGSKIDTQLIAANVDTVFVVSSLNQDFNLNRIERFLALVKEASAEAVVVLTKMDQRDDPQAFAQQVQKLDPLLNVVTTNALDSESLSQLEPWCTTGKTVAFLGSSGVGKSTLINTLSEKNVQETSSIREDDSKGRHTTTSRSLHQLEHGGLVIDTPGMRELQLHHCEHGIEETFTDVIELSQSCKFSDCQHDQEPGCAVQQAITSGELDSRRLRNYQKLMREQAFNNETLAERRARDRDFGKMIKTVLAANTKRL